MNQSSKRTFSNKRTTLVDLNDSGVKRIRSSGPSSSGDQRFSDQLYNQRQNLDGNDPIESHKNAKNSSGESMPQSGDFRINLDDIGLIPMEDVAFNNLEHFQNEPQARTLNEITRSVQECSDPASAALDLAGPVRLLGEQERFLPLANIARVMKRYIPEMGKVAKDAKECMQECVSEFISFITSEASDRCREEKRKTISGEDILTSMHALGFEQYVEPLKVYMNKYRACYKGEKHLMDDQITEFDIDSPFDDPIDDPVHGLRDVIETIQFGKAHASNAIHQERNQEVSSTRTSALHTLTADDLNALFQSGQLVLTPLTTSPQQQSQVQPQQKARAGPSTLILTPQAQQQQATQQIPIVYLDPSTGTIHHQAQQGTQQTIPTATSQAGGVQFLQIVSASSLAASQTSQQPHTILINNNSARQPNFHKK